MRKMLWAIAVLIGTTTMVHATNLTHTVQASVLQATTGDKYAILVQSTKNLRASIMTASQRAKSKKRLHKKAKQSNSTRIILTTEIKYCLNNQVYHGNQ